MFIKNKLARIISFALLSSTVVAQVGDVPLPGGLDTSFGNNGVVKTTVPLSSYGLEPLAQAADHDGNAIIVGRYVGDDFDIFIAKLDRDGQLDSNFADNGIFTQALTGEQQAIKVIVDSNNRAIIVIKDGTEYSLQRFTASGQLDPSFASAGSLTLSTDDFNSSTTLHIDSQDRLVVANAKSLTRLLPDGDIDSEFGNNGVVTTDIVMYSALNKVAIDQQDNLYIYGPANNSAITVQKYNPDGSLASDFGDNNGAATVQFDGISIEMQNITVDSKGNILLAGVTNSFDSQSHLQMVRLTSAGLPDQSFGVDGAVVSQADEGTQLFALTLDDHDNPIVMINLYKVFPMAVVYYSATHIRRFTQDGSLDSQFGDDGVIALPYQIRNRLNQALLFDDKGIRYLTTDSQLEPAQVQYNHQGQLDQAFANMGKTNIVKVSNRSLNTVTPTIDIDSQGRLRLSGYVYPYTNSSYSSYPIPYITRLTADGEPDQHYGQLNGTSSFTYLASIRAVDQLGNVYVSGPNRKTAISRYSAAGELDSTFGNNGVISPNGSFERYDEFHITFDKAGHIYVSVGDTVSRYDSKGNVDSSFGEDGVKTFKFRDNIAVWPQDNGHYYVTTRAEPSPSGPCGAHAIMEMFEFNQDDSPATTFGNDGKLYLEYDCALNTPQSLKVDNKGKLLLVVNAGGSRILTRLLPNGQLDTSFAEAGVLHTGSNDFIIDSNANIIVATDAENTVYATRYLSDGSLDKRFGEAGIATVGSNDNFSREYTIGSALDDSGYLYLSSTKDQDLGIYKVFSGYPALNQANVGSTLFNQNSPGVIKTTDLDLGQTAIDSLTEITLNTLPEIGSLFIDSNNNSSQDSSEASLAVNDVISIAQLNANQLIYTPSESISSFDFDATTDNSTTSATQRLVVNPAPVATIASSLGDSSKQASIPVTIAFNEAVYGFTAQDVNLDNGAISDFTGSGNQYSFTVTPSSIGAVNITLAQNAAVDYNDAGSKATTWSFEQLANQVPVISGSPETSVNEDSSYQFTPTATDADPTNSLTFSIVNKPNWAQFDETTGTLSGDPVNADVGTTSNIVISVSDGQDTSSLAAFSLEVVNVNDAPTISGTPSTSVNQDQAYSFIPLASDVDANAQLTFTIVNKPHWAQFDAATGALTGTPTNDHVGISSGIVISVLDSTISTSLDAFDLEVVNVNDAPTISGTPVTSITAGQAYSFNVQATDIDIADSLTFSLTNQPSWMNIDSTTGAVSGNPSAADVGNHNDIVVKVTDSQNATASLAAFNVQVNAVVITSTSTSNGGGSFGLGIFAGLFGLLALRTRRY